MNAFTQKPDLSKWVAKLNTSEKSKAGGLVRRKAEPSAVILPGSRKTNPKEMQT